MFSGVRVRLLYDLRRSCGVRMRRGYERTEAKTQLEPGVELRAKITFAVKSAAR